MFSDEQMEKEKHLSAWKKWNLTEYRKVELVLVGGGGEGDLEPASWSERLQHVTHHVQLTVFMELHL